MRRIRQQHGFTMIELVIVIVIIGILASVATIKMNQSVDTAMWDQTTKELDNLAHAITGNPALYSNGARTDFGFVGDNGVLPASLDCLVTNPGGWSTWDGPYIHRGLNSDDFKKDAWNVNYVLSDTLIQSTGSGSDIDKPLAASSSALLANRISGFVVDANRQIPPAGFLDSIEVILSYPTGSGSRVDSTLMLDSRGRFDYSNVPIGNHTLRVIHIPASDTVRYSVAVCPDRDVSLEITFPADLW
jgi:prepilin-type N-terminal cleavage/methylation domain-containing protein